MLCTRTASTWNSSKRLFLAQASPRCMLPRLEALRPVACPQKDIKNDLIFTPSLGRLRTCDEQRGRTGCSRLLPSSAHGNGSLYHSRRSTHLGTLIGKRDKQEREKISGEQLKQHVTKNADEASQQSTASLLIPFLSAFMACPHRSSHRSSSSSRETSFLMISEMPFIAHSRVVARFSVKPSRNPDSSFDSSSLRANIPSVHDGVRATGAEAPLRRPARSIPLRGEGDRRAI
eukprot:749671-Hanusia_phi.AAC.4